MALATNMIPTVIDWDPDSIRWPISRYRSVSPKKKSECRAMAQTAYKGTWVKISDTILKVGERAPNIPAETAKVPLVMHLNGFLLTDEAQLGDRVTIETLSSRIVTGDLIEINPHYTHSFGRFIPELGEIGPHLRKALEKEVEK